MSSNYINKIFCCDCLEGMKSYLPDESIHLIFTSPPYFNAREYSTFSHYQEYLHFMHAVIREFHRVLKEGRFLVINTSPIISPRKARQEQSIRYAIPFDLHKFIMNSSFMFLDDILWIKPEPSVKNRNASFYQHRKPLAYKPNSMAEYLMVYRKKTKKLIDWNLKQYKEEIINESLVNGIYEQSNVWFINPEARAEHPAVFPEELSDKVIKYYSMKDDLVLDSFIGSGTTAVSCKKLSRKYAGFEKNEKYCLGARKRVKNYKVSLTIDYFLE